MAGRSWKPAYYPLDLLGWPASAWLSLRAVNPALFRSMPACSASSPRPALCSPSWRCSPSSFPAAHFSFQIAWANFTTSFFISFIALAMLAFATVRARSADRTLFLIWSIIMLMAVLGQRRFGYYFVINAALLTGYFSWKMLDLAGLGKLLAGPKQAAVAVKEFRKKRKQTRDRPAPLRSSVLQPRGAWLLVIATGIALFFLVIFPNFSGARQAGPHAQLRHPRGLVYLAGLAQGEQPGALRRSRLLLCAVPAPGWLPVS
jgi:hypothetical protein